MDVLRTNPHLYEINLMTWLKDLGAGAGENVSLKNIPQRVWSDLKDRGMDLIWLMGVWHRSADARRRARLEPGLIKVCRSMLADFKIEDIAGSPYAIDQYAPDPSFGSAQDLQSLKRTLEDMGFVLILDFVPNHTACDHPWITIHPEYYIRAGMTRKGTCKKGFYQPPGLPENVCIAHGKDPFYHPWTDTAQVNYADPEAKTAMLNTLLTDVSPYCHGVRCDMAMLVLNKVFWKTWRRYLKDREGSEFWRLVKKGLRSAGRACLLIGEVYWDMAQALISLGFDYTYDKVFYDLLVAEDIQGLKKHLSVPVDVQEKTVRFLENHDEPRALKVFGQERIYSAMVIHATVPGMRFWHYGQFEGRRIRVPVQLRRTPTEPIAHALQKFSDALLREVDHPVFHDGEWKMCRTAGWQDNLSHRGLLTWCWRLGEERRLIVVNFTPAPAQGRVRVPADWFPSAGSILFHDPLKGDKYRRSMAQVRASGLHVELGPWDYHFFRGPKDFQI